MASASHLTATGTAPGCARHRETARRRGTPAADRFTLARDRVHGLLPAVLRLVVPATAVGFAAISTFTYAVDLTLLAVLFDGLGVPYPLAVTVGYVVAFGLAFVLNRRLNFRSTDHVGRQSARYVATVVVNYLLFILLLSSVLEAVATNYLLARLIAGACEAVFMYLMMRLVVFRRA
ncbi:hypothetical protein GCM10009584_04840 [Ornithinimicrobium humiphilum]|uniref:Putative flippase GtrA n=1 Tax=Ornithinimicrobium humiphilum TaxID=125288 RepID=A0A543K801_9MICO|nr:GtrA family protein [Ornithinimicrobium humiphilum]TQM91212.1 putative flippase GtrA [Ornithinimicrobium humiphilum]